MKTSLQLLMAFSHEASVGMLNFLQNKRRKAQTLKIITHIFTLTHTQRQHVFHWHPHFRLWILSLLIYEKVTTYGLFTRGVSEWGTCDGLLLGAWCCTSHWPLPRHFKLRDLGCACIWGIDKSFLCLLHKDGTDIRRTTWNPGNTVFATSRSYHQKQRGKANSFHKFWGSLFIFICLFFPSPFSLSLVNIHSKPQLQNTNPFK